MQESQIKRIFGSMINQKLVEFDEDVKTIADVLTEATIEMYDVVVHKFLPTPAKIHYLFNLRDISRVSSCITQRLWSCALRPASFSPLV